jgi:hypothetical protein
MNDLILKGAARMSTYRAIIADDLQSRKARAESGDIVQTIIIIAMFVLICMVVGGILYTAINGQATKVGDCITNSNSGKCTNFKK